MYERPHTLQLARPKTPHPESLHEKPVQTSVPPAALYTVRSERHIRLSSPKQRPIGPFRSATWKVPAHVRNATASVRCVELAGPKGTVDGYKLHKDAGGSVSRAARRAVITPRVEELAKPIIRASVEQDIFDPDAFTVKSALYGSFSSKRIARLAEPVDR